MLISTHFSLEEMVFSAHALRLGIDNTPPPAAIENMHRLGALVLEPVHRLWGVPVHVDSGYRSWPLNAVVGGAKDSVHPEGRAADLLPEDMDLRWCFDQVRLSDLPYEQVILECNAWIHVSVARLGQTPRREALLASGSPGHWTYQNA